MKYMVAIDSGGTKTETVLFDSTGHILTRDLSPGANGMDIGKDEAVRRLVDVLDRVTPRSPEKLAAIYGGIAGVMPLGDFYTPVVGPKNYAASIRFDDDGPSLISAAIGHRDGCGMVVGTGSSCFIRVEGQSLRLRAAADEPAGYPPVQELLLRLRVLRGLSGGPHHPGPEG